MNHFYFSQKQADLYHCFNDRYLGTDGEIRYTVNRVMVDGKMTRYTEWCVNHTTNSLWDDMVLVAEIPGKPQIFCGPELW